jgi:hypothetical protein
LEIALPSVRFPPTVLSIVEFEPGDMMDSYEKPEIVDLGSVEDLTLTDNKQLAGTDGIIFQNQALGDIS